MAARSHEDEEDKRRQKNAKVAIAAFTQSQKGSGKSKPVCRDYVTDTGCSKGGQCSYQHPPTNGRCLRCGAAKHSVADCRRPKKTHLPIQPPKPKARGKDPLYPRQKPNGLPTAEERARAKEEEEELPNSKRNPRAKPRRERNLNQSPSPKPRLQATRLRQKPALWRSSGQAACPYDPPAGALGSEDVPFTGCISIDHFAHAYTFYTTFQPSFHSTESADANGISPPILDTGATHFLLPLKWLHPKQAANSKRTHLKP